MMGLHFDTNGELVHGELKGPPSITHWQACWVILQTALIMLDIADPADLIAYSQHIHELAQVYGARCWPILYQAEYRFRREHMERVKRNEFLKLEANLAKSLPYHELNINRPWARVFHLATTAECSEYWRKKLERNCTLV